jgi:two-component system response regulator RpfG
MSKYSRLIAEGLGLRSEECDVIEMAAPMHDIGKIGIPDAILLKRGPHTPEEREIMRRHTLIGYEILRHSDSKYLRLGADIAIGHHERYDGNGYPKGLAGDAIPIAARIVAVADVFDALTSVRPYKSAWPLTRALDYVREHSGTQFDPACAESFLRQVEGIVYIAEQFADGAARAERGRS